MATCCRVSVAVVGFSSVLCSGRSVHFVGSHVLNLMSSV